MNPSCGCAGTSMNFMAGGGYDVETQHVGGGEYVNTLVNAIIPIGFVVASHLLRKKDAEKPITKGGGDVSMALQNLSNRINNILHHQEDFHAHA